MGSSKRDALDRAFRQLQSQRVELADYEGAVRDVAFELYTADTYIAGIATTLLAGGTVPQEHRPLLRRLFLRDDGSWLMPDGTAFDLQPYSELLEFARTIEIVRKECAKCARPA